MTGLASPALLKCWLLALPRKNLFRCFLPFWLRWPRWWSGIFSRPSWVSSDANCQSSLVVWGNFVLVLAPFLHVVAISSSNPVGTVHLLTESACITGVFGIIVRIVLAAFWRVFLARRYVIDFGLIVVSKKDISSWRGYMYLNLISVFHIGGLKGFCWRHCCFDSRLHGLKQMVLPTWAIMVSKKPNLASTDVCPIFGC